MPGHSNILVDAKSSFKFLSLLLAIGTYIVDNHIRHGLEISDSLQGVALSHIFDWSDFRNSNFYKISKICSYLGQFDNSHVAEIHKSMVQKCEDNWYCTVHKHMMHSCY